MSVLPIDAVLPELLAALRAEPNVVLSAEPGAGKTTRVPLALMADAAFAPGKILMLEPRRLAAIRAAEYMASQLGERVGQQVGYRIRGESKVSAATRVEVVTEGILTRMLQDDPSLEGVSVVIFDEFHERSIHADLGLALTLEAQDALRDDLRVLVMSATLDGVAISSLLNDCPVISSTGRSFPVQTVYAPRPNDYPLEKSIVTVVQKALKENEGDVLVFLPGQREIRRAESELSELLQESVAIHALFGEASISAQQAALKPDAQGRRKIILATAIAETSLTIDGVRVVIDSGLARQSRFDPRRGMSGLVTTMLSQATAEQRRGRAGRTAPGICYRLWSESQQQSLARFPTPEILSTDLAPFALEIAQWGVTDVATLRLLDAPPAAHLQQARDLLQHLQALDHEHRLTEHGKAMVALPVHPRYAHMLLKAREFSQVSLACDIAALLEERDLLRGQQGGFRDVDFHQRWLALQHGGAVDRGARERAKAQSARLKKMLRAEDSAVDEDFIGPLLALAFPERVCKQRQKQSLRYQSAAGVGLSLPDGSPLHKCEWLAVAEVDGVGQDARIFLAAEIKESLLREVLASHIETRTEGFWDEKSDALVARDAECIGALIVSEKPTVLNDETRLAAVIAGIRSLGLSVLHWSDKAKGLRERVQWLREQAELDDSENDRLPDLSDVHLLATLEQWLAPFLSGVTRKAHLQQLDVFPALSALLDYDTMRWLDAMAPTHLTVPTGTAVAIGYSQHPPVLAVRLQEMFGQMETPTLAKGRIPVMLHLLSPARRPLAVTQDLQSFWQNAWQDVRKDMRGQYPKHYWPENPLEAEPTRRSKAADDRARKST